MTSAGSPQTHFDAALQLLLLLAPPPRPHVSYQLRAYHHGFGGYLSGLSFIFELNIDSVSSLSEIEILSFANICIV